MPGCCWKYLLITKDADLLKRSPMIAEKRISIVILLDSSTGMSMEEGVILVVLVSEVFGYCSVSTEDSEICLNLR